MSSAAADPKIIDLINETKTNGVVAPKKSNGALISLEYFPPRTETGVKNLNNRMDRMKKNLDPLFTDMTWGAGGSTADLSMELALRAHNNGHVANLHLTCTNMTKNGDPIAAVHDALQTAHDGGIRNIVALRGDPPAGEEEWTAAEGGFTCALDLVKYIRKHFGNDFGISVAGYPEGHPNAITELKEGEIETLSESEKTRYSEFDGKIFVCKDEDYKKEMDYLKEKVDAGADIVITQMFFDVEVFKTFVQDCRKWGIECPIVPGLMCINAYAGFKKMTKFCKTRVPKDLEAKMDSMKDDVDAVKAFGVQFGAEVCQSLIDFGTEVLHFYTLNLEKVVYGITDALGLTNGLIEKSNEKDAASMVAVGSAWARIGDKVKSIYGEGIVKEIRKGGEAVIEMSSWELAGGQKPTAFLQKAHYEKVYESVPDANDSSTDDIKVGDRVKSIYGEGIVKELRSGGEAVIEMMTWELAGGQRPTAFLQKAHYEKIETSPIDVGDKVTSIYGEGFVKEVRAGEEVVIEMSSWELAFGQKPKAYLQKGHYEKLSSGSIEVGDKVKSIYGEGIVKEIRTDDEIVVEMTTWELAGGQKPTAFLQKGHYDMLCSGTISVGDKVKSVYGEGMIKEIRADDAIVIEMTTWELAGGQRPTAFLQVGNYEKL